MRNRFTAGLLAATVGAGLLTAGAPAAHASSKGRKNTTIGLGAAALYELLQGNTTAGLIAGAGTAYAYKRYHDARNDERLYNYNNRSNRRVPTYRSRRLARPSSDGSVFQFPNGTYTGSGSSSQSQYGDTWNTGGYNGNGTYQSQNGGRWGKGGYGSDTYQSQNGGYYQNDGTPCPRGGSSTSSGRGYRYSRYSDDRGNGYRSHGNGEYRGYGRDR